MCHSNMYRGVHLYLLTPRWKSVLGRYLTYLILSYLLPVACVRKSYRPKLRR